MSTGDGIFFSTLLVCSLFVLRKFLRWWQETSWW